MLQCQVFIANFKDSSHCCLFSFFVGKTYADWKWLLENYQI